MRLWTLHPKYLDARGLVALWREGLLAQKVLRGRTKGYRRHSQLLRFRAATRPLAAINHYLHTVCDEATRRGYRFDRAKLARPRAAARLVETRGQLHYEWSHLVRKLQRRDRRWLAGLAHVKSPRPHPLFRIVPGPVRDWEKVITA